jgi:hypothetical protein
MWSGTGQQLPRAVNRHRQNKEEEVYAPIEARRALLQQPQHDERENHRGVDGGVAFAPRHLVAQVRVANHLAPEERVGGIVRYAERVLQFVNRVRALRAKEKETAIRQLMAGETVDAVNHIRRRGDARVHQNWRENRQAGENRQRNDREREPVLRNEQDDAVNKYDKTPRARREGVSHSLDWVNVSGCLTRMVAALRRKRHLPQLQADAYLTGRAKRTCFSVTTTNWLANCPA